MHRFVKGLLCSVVTGGLVAGLGLGAVGASATAPVTDARSAAALAVRTGRSVVVPSLTTAGSVTRVNPDGTSTTEFSAVPVGFGASSPTATGLTMVDRLAPTTSAWDLPGRTNEGIGLMDSAADGVHVRWLLFQYPTGSLNSAHILSATFRAFETWAPSCSASTVQAWETGPISASTTWATQPTWRRKLDSQSVAYGQPDCSPGDGDITFDVLGGLLSSKAGGSATTTIGLKAWSEDTTAAAKRFRRDASLSVTYNHVPQVESVGTVYPTTTCVTGPGRPSVPRVDPPRLQAFLSDADTGESLTAYFGVTKADRRTFVFTGQTSPKLPGGAFQVEVPNDTLPDGTYAWRMHATDGTDWTPYSPFCEFTVDGTRPLTPGISPVVATGHCRVLPDDSTHQPATCAVGSTALFHVISHDASAVQYAWSINSQVPTSDHLSTSSADLSITFGYPGPTSLRVWTFDAAGNMSDPAEIEFRVAS